MQQLPTTRSCGPCRGCCLPWAVPEVGKFDATWCPKSTPCNGCSIYETRPKACREFACLWLNGKGEENDRPDILGIMMDIEDFQLGSREVGILHLWEIEKGAMDKPRVLQITEANKRAGNIVAFHRPQGTDAYASNVCLPAEHFTKLEVALFNLTYRW